MSVRRIGKYFAKIHAFQYQADHYDLFAKQLIV